MFNNILKFELYSRFTHWMTLLFILIMVYQGIWYTKGFYDFYGGDGMLINAAGVFYQNLAGCGILMIIIVAILTGPMLYKDIQYKTSNWMYTLPISDKQFFIGRFLSAFLINVAIASFYLVGMLLVPFAGFGESNLFGAAPIGQLLHGFLILTVPNIFLLTCICFAAIVFFRRSAAGYLLIFLTVILFLVMQTTSETSGKTMTTLLADPFAYVCVNQQVEMMPVAERNSGYISLSGSLLINRLIWFGVALLSLIMAYFKFSFKYFYTAGRNKKDKGQTIYSSPTDGEIKTVLPQSESIIPDLQYGTLTLVKKLGNLAALEFKNIVRPQSFRLILGILILFSILQNLMWNASHYIGPQVPVTSAMTNFRITFGVFLIMLLMIWAGELFFKDKTANIWQITDALPLPVWVSQSSKLLAMFGVGFLLNFIFMLCGITAQILQGGAATIDMGLFLNDYLGYNWGWLNHCLYIALVFFIAGLTGKRFLTHILSTGYFFLLLVGFELNLIEDLRFGYGTTPGFESYSEMNGYGIWTTASFWYFLMWLALASALVLLGILFWDRGLEKSILKKLQFRSSQLNILGKLTVPVLLAAFVLLQSFIYKEVTGKDNFELEKYADENAASYEQKYGSLASQPQPKYSNLDLNIDFYPSERRAIYRVSTRLENQTEQAINSLSLSLPGHVSLNSLNIDGNTIPFKLDEEYDIVSLLLPSQLDTNSSIKIEMDLVKSFIGFSQDDPQAALAYEGAFGTIDDYLPSIGFDEAKTLTDNRTRAEFKLPRLTSLLPEVNDVDALSNSVYRTDALPSLGTLTISTENSQTPIGPGNIVKQWTEGNRNYVSFDIAQEAPLNWCLGSAPYQIEKASKESIETSVFNYPNHPYNSQLYQAILQKGVEFIKAKLGNYPYKEVRLYEIPHYQEPVYAFNGGIAISEKEGWIADTAGLKERAYLYQTVAAGLFQHWVIENISIGNVQGADMLRLALPEALALQFVELNLGEEAIEFIIEQKEKIYNKDRFSDPNGEPALLYADGKDYLEINHGAIQLYKWSKEMSFKKFNESLLSWVAQSSDLNTTFKSLYDYLLVQLPSTAAKEQAKRRFEQVL